jgi:hypothetical protein
MSKRKDATGVGRRGFLKGAALAGAATTLASPLTAQATPTPPKRGKAPQGVSEIQKVAETAQPNPMADVPKAAQNLVSPTSGSDFMVEGFKNLGFEYLAAMPGSSAACRNPSSTTARTPRRNGSSASTKKFRSRCRKAMPRSKASRC